MSATDPNRPKPAGRPTSVIQQRHSRWARSEVSFGPAGRVVVTILLFVPVWFGIFYSVFFLVAAAIWLFCVIPMAYRDVWRKVRAAPTDADLIAVAYDRAFPDDGSPRSDIGSRETPSRW
jgi:hypothetical protein